MAAGPDHSVEIIDSEGDSEDDVMITGISRATPIALNPIVIDDNEEATLTTNQNGSDDELQIVREQRRPGNRQQNDSSVIFSGIRIFAPNQVYRIPSNNEPRTNRPFARTAYPGSATLDLPASSRLRRRPPAIRFSIPGFSFTGGPYDFNVRFGSNGDYEAEDDGDIPPGVMETIRQWEEADDNRRVSDRQSMANKWRQTNTEKSTISAPEKKYFTSEISNKQNQVCVLCGVVLGEGIPEDFNTSKGEPDESDVQEYVSRQHIRAPWRFTDMLTPADRDLSKKIFFARCGHVYCGRCVNNINRYLPSKTGEKAGKNKRRKTVKVDFDNPGTMDFRDYNLFAPNSCAAEGCEKKTSTKAFFRELFV
ncbi:unnamed protein product [Kuraishia capsulata CBS 1993]|uniref:Uncharacterized protein n=1 Tax=Kuraishia capsulata CBS 1993 TaxID=1382522 RepID=W6MXH1_9ASCO|nr:uncharacterized protein KUCA_T00004865001 [Kuraishia capsulata CBS 1993]CDK28880.1 unnamed protein product [Kuraishia capsulata CBS 1993]